MKTTGKFDPVSVADYLAGEEAAVEKHEYVCGEVYAQAGGTNAYNCIATNATVELGSLLRGHQCKVYNSDTKIRICSDDGTRFFYPDLSVICDSNPAGDSFQDRPVVIVEVLSPSTRRQDLGEKRENYCKLPSLHSYVLLEQSSAAAIVFQRSEKGEFERNAYVGLDQVIPLLALDLELSLKSVFDGIDLE
ncbi:Uma2 family endonuclease [bacterium]|nr:Uma2 family endonuclease [bacterium]